MANKILHTTIMQKSNSGDKIIIYPKSTTKNIIDGSTTLDKTLETLKTSDISNKTTEFQQATIRENLVSGESIATSHGKIMKLISDLKSLAYSDKVGVSNLDTALTSAYNNRVTTDKVTTSTTITSAGYVADARAVSSLQNQINTINKNISNNFGYVFEGSFAQYPSAWLGENNTATFKGVSITKVEDYNAYTPSDTKESNGCAWWNVITFGVGNRCTQLAFYGFNIYKTEVFYFRRQHDNYVTSWQKVTTNSDIQWIYYKQIEYNIETPLPTSFNELNVYVYMHSYWHVFNINRKMLSETYTPFLNGSYWNSSNNYGIRIDVSTKYIKLVNSYYNSSNLNNAYMKVFYR